MQRLNHGTLHERMSRPDEVRPYLRWMQQLSEAVACLESHGYVHGDINPQNILFDEQDQLKLIDFDYALKIGDDLNVGYEPYVRSRRRGEEGGDYGVAGPITEQLALGSVFWFMTRGAELYHDIEGPEQVDRLMNAQFPATNSQDEIDCIIHNCWHGKFPSVTALYQQIREVTVFGDEYRARKKECQCWHRRLKDLEGRSAGARSPSG